MGGFESDATHTKKPRAEATAFAVRTGLRRRKLGSRMAPLCCDINASLLLLSPKIGDFRGPYGEGRDADNICYQ